MSIFRAKAEWIFKKKALIMAQNSYLVIIELTAKLGYKLHSPTLCKSHGKIIIKLNQLYLNNTGTHWAISFDSIHYIILTQHYYFPHIKTYRFCMQLFKISLLHIKLKRNFFLKRNIIAELQMNNEFKNPLE